MTEDEFKKHIEAAENNPKQLAAAVLGLPAERLRHKPAPEKWCILEILGHLADVEIVFGHRIRQMLAEEKPIIAPMDQNAWTRNLGYMETTARRTDRPLRNQPSSQSATLATNKAAGSGQVRLSSRA